MRATTTSPAQLWRTGQTTCYDSTGTVIACAGTGQDGEIQAGVAWPSPRFIDNGDGTVTDNLTWLMWTQDANLSGSTKTWQEALDYVAGMNAGTYPNFGYTDWHLPNRKEFISLADYSQYMPALSLGHPFTNVPIPSLYWSSTTYAQGPSNDWLFIIWGGHTGVYDKTQSNVRYFWPVRGGEIGVNQPPLADAGPDQNIYLTETAQLDGINSSDPDADPIASYTWAVESAPLGSTATLSNSTIVNPTFTPDLEGQYIISLVVNDGTYNSAMDTVIINVTLNLPPAAAATAFPITGDAPLTVNFDASGSIDPELGALTFDWDFGDPLSIDNTSTLVNPIHTYNNVGSYTAIVTVTDDFNNTDQASALITVTAPNQPPTVAPSATPSNGMAPLTVQLTSNANDPEGDLLTYTWDFGDGTPLSTEANPIHTYANLGTYIATVTVSDGEFNITGEVIISISSSLTIDVTQAKVDFGKKGKVEGKVNLKADFTYTGIPGIYDLITVTFDGVTLVEEPFLSFEEDDDDPGEYKYKEKNIYVKIDFNKKTIKVSRHKMVLTGIDNSNGIDVVISFGDSTGTDQFVMKEKEKDDDDDDDDDDEKKLSYKEKKDDDE